MDCATFKELVGLFALGALTADERAEAEAHLALPQHEGCLEALAEAMQGASVLDGDGHGQGERPAPQVWQLIQQRIAPNAARLRRARRIARMAGAFAAAAALLLAYVVYRPPGLGPALVAVESLRRESADKAAALTATTTERDECQKRNQLLEQDQRLPGEAVALLQLAGTRLFPLPAEKGQTATANVILHSGLKRAFVVTEGLRPVAEHDYELWVAHGKKVVPAGLVHVDAAGRAVARVDYEKLLGDVGAPDAMMITLEPSGGGDVVRGPTIVIGVLHS